MNGRFPSKVFSEGDEPDVRFTLANERTFLAWIRTALALMAAGVAVETFEVGVDPRLRLAVALLLVLSGTLAGARSFAAWAWTERALRLRTPLPSTSTKPVVAAAATLAGLMLAVGLVR